MKLCFYIVLLILSLNIVYGFGMASTYLEDKIMYLAAGEIREYKVELQNNDPVVQKVNFDLESDIATIKNKQDYYLIGGDKIKESVILVIEIPKNVQIGKEYTVKYSAVPISGAGSQISMSIKFSNEFKVIVGEKELGKEEIKSDLGFLPIILFLVVIFGLAILLIFKKNKALITRILKK